MSDMKHVLAEQYALRRYTSSVSRSICADEFLAGWAACEAHASQATQVCDFCQGTGQHLSPESAKPIMVLCEKKGCTAFILRGKKNA